MNAMGLSMIMRMGCLCSKEVVTVNGKKYSVLEHLGEGGFSTVALVEESLTRRKYALKKIICHSPEDQRLAVREIEYHEVVKHPNVIELIDSDYEGNADPVFNATSEVLLILPYYHRGTLANELERRAKFNSYLSSIDVLNIFLKICEGVKAFHEAKPEPLAHRDLKTANIVLGDGMNPVIMDLGSVAPARLKICGNQAAQTLQDLAAERCSMPYRAPELFNVQSYCMIDERTDIWSLGCILYALCNFRSPFDAVYEKGDSVALAVMSANISFPESSPYGEDIQNLILSMIKVNPMERPYIFSIIENAHEILDKLEGKV